MTELLEAVKNGDVRHQTHPDFPHLSIFNYTEEVQFKNRWNKITLACRGLILSVTGEVIARAWEKFFNLGQMDNRIDSDAPVEVTDKMDGSLGILYRAPDGQWAIATRGSFASEQAIHATKVLYQNYRQDIPNFEFVTDYTFLFEIVYPENRIVVNYDGLDDLVLLGAVHKKRGYYLGPTEACGILGWNGPVTEVFHAKDFVSAISLPDRKGKEGYVIRSGRNIVKLKQADYVELHRIVTNLSPKTIWEMLGSGKSIGDICAGIPDEFHSYVVQHGQKLLQDASDIKYRASVSFNQAKRAAEAKTTNSIEPGVVSRRAYAEEIKKYQDAGLLFSLLDGRPIDDTIWKMIRPRGDQPLVKDE